MTTDPTPVRQCPQCGNRFVFSNTHCTVDHGEYCCHQHDAPANPLDDIRARHRQEVWKDDNGVVVARGRLCTAPGCGQDWPCDAAQLVARLDKVESMLTPERIAEALLSCNLIHRYREYAEQASPWMEEHATDEWLAEAWAIQLHAALTKEPK